MVYWRPPLAAVNRTGCSGPGHEFMKMGMRMDMVR